MSRRTPPPAEQCRFGAHMSIAGGLHRAFAEGTAVGCDAIQVFVKNQRQWKAKPITADEANLWKEAQRISGIGPVVAHNTYLINLGSPDEAAWQRSIAAFIDELERCEQLAIPYLVAHPGSHLGAGEDAGLHRIADAIDHIHRSTPGFAVQILLETTAGQGTNLGQRFEHLAGIIERVREPDRLGVCFDTCHVFAAGYDLRTDAGYDATMSALDRTVGLDRVRAFHLNDSLKPLGSRRDRHAHIGAGCIGRAAFKRLVNDTRFLGRPMLLETPKGVDERGRDYDALTLAALRRMIHIA